MHDLHLANQIVKIAEEHAQRRGFSSVKKIVLELGDIIEHGENITPDNLKYNINLLLPDVETEIKKTKGATWKLTEIETE